MHDRGASFWQMLQSYAAVGRTEVKGREGYKGMHEVPVTQCAPATRSLFEVHTLSYVNASVALSNRVCYTLTVGPDAPHVCRLRTGETSTGCAWLLCLVRL